MNWKKAQESELKSWAISNEKARREKIEREIARYPRLRREMGLHLINLKDKHVLEIGGGPIGVIADLHCKKKYIVEPLTSDYRKYWSCPYHIEIRGEKMLFKDNSIDLVVIVNALDHCEDPEKVISEVKRVLRPGRFLAVHNCINLSKTHPHPAHILSLDEDWFHNQLDFDFEFVHELSWSKDGLRYGWVKNKYDGRIGQPAISFLARKVTGYD